MEPSILHPLPVRTRFRDILGWRTQDFCGAFVTGRCFRREGRLRRADWLICRFHDADTRGRVPKRSVDHDSCGLYGAGFHPQSVGAGLFYVESVKLKSGVSQSSLLSLFTTSDGSSQQIVFAAWIPHTLIGVGIVTIL